MPSTYSSRLRIELQADGENAGTWGQVTNRNLGTLLETAIAGYRTIAMPDANYTLTTSNGLDDEARYAMLNFTGTLTATREVVVPAVSKLYVVKNQTNQTLSVKTSAGAARAVPAGKTVMVFIDGTDAFDILNDLTALSVSGTSALGVTSATNLSYTGTLTGGTGVVNIGSGQFFKDAGGNLGLGTITPTRKLDVVGTALIRNGTDGLVIGESTGSSARANLFFSGTDSAGSIRQVYIGTNITGTAGNLEIFNNTAGTVATFDSAGNAGLGVTPSAWGSQKALEFQYGALSAGNALGTELVGNSFYNGTNWIYRETGTAFRYNQASAGHSWFTAPSGTAGSPITFTQAATLFQSGNLNIGGTSDLGNRITITGADTTTFARFSSSSSSTFIGGAAGLISGAANADSAVRSDANLLFAAGGGTEAARITSTRYFKASNTGTYAGAGSSFHELVNNQNTATLVASGTSAEASVNVYNSQLPSGAAGVHANYQTNAVTVFQVLANGNVQNTNNSYGALSDAKLKNVVGPAPSYWERYKLIEWVKYTLKNDPTNQEQLGVIAQQVRNIFPGLIEETPDMHEVTKTREVTKTVPVTTTEMQTTERTEIKLVNGKYVQVTTVTPTEVQVPVIDEFPVYDEAGQPVMQLVSPAVEAQDAVLDDEGNELQPAVAARSAVYAPLMHKVLRMQTITETETYTEMEPSGTVTLSVKYSILGHISDVVLQEAMARIEHLEQMVGA